MQLQVSVHDWTKPGTAVWTSEHGHLCPPLEKPEIGQTVMYIDYLKNDLSETLIQSDVELAIDALGYPAGPRYLGESPKDLEANVVSYVGTVATQEVALHLEKLKSVIPIEVVELVTA